MSFNRKIEAALGDTESKRGRDKALAAIRHNMRPMVENYPDLQERLRSIKEQSLRNLPSLLKQAVSRLEQNGCHVFLAWDDQAAREYILRLVDQGPVVKSKSNVAKEIGIVEALENNGIQVVETDLGDWINQLLQSPASHPLAPAIHVPQEKVRRAFSDLVGYELPDDVNQLVGVARQHLRSILETAGFGLTGANAVAADTGTVILMENEGNIRAVTSLPRVHIVVAGINKVVPTFEDGVLVVQAASVYGVGQDFGTYMSAVSGPAPEGKRCGPAEVHVVLVDNGRSRAREEGFQEALYCINCGSCQNFCPVYDSIGNSFGKKYIGGIGVIQTAFNRSLTEAGESGLWACLGCRTCVAVCPARIDTPSMINRLRNQVVGGRGLPGVRGYLLQRVLPRQQRVAKASRWAFRLKGTLFRPEDGRRGVRFRIPLAGVGGRLLPGPVKQSFLQTVPAISPVPKARMRVAFFVGCLVNAAYTQVGWAALKLLRQSGVEVVTPPAQECCGLPLLSNGDPEGAGLLARQNLDLFDSLEVDRVVNVCATCGHMIKNEYPRLFAGGDQVSDQALRVAGKTVDISAFLVDDLKMELGFSPSRKVKVTYHDPCHLRAGQGVAAQPRRLLRAVEGVELVEMAGADQCCGFGGTVSLEHYCLTKAISSDKVRNIIDTGAEVVCTSCPGCMATLADGLYRHSAPVAVKHLVELLAVSDGGKDS